MAFSPPYNTQGTFPALRSALVAAFPTLSLFYPLIVIDFIIYIFISILLDYKLITYRLVILYLMYDIGE